MPQTLCRVPLLTTPALPRNLRILRERAALWAGTVTSGLPAGSGVGSIAASPALASSLSVAGAVDAPSAGVGLRDVVVEVRTLDSSNGREVWAATPVAAPPEMVWRTLTDYERLAGACFSESEQFRVARVRVIRSLQA